METPEDIESYDSINDCYLPIIIYVILSLCLFELLKEILLVSKALLGIISFMLTLVGISFQALRNRYCKICGKKMEKFFDGKFLPRYHYCKTCRVKINTLVRNRTT